MNTCRSCGQPLKSDRYKGLCQSCYTYFRKGGTVNPLPSAGKIEKDYRGYVVCHICGKAYKRLGSHIKEKHNMTIADYKKQFGLCANVRTTEDSYHDTMRNYALVNNMDKQLIDKGLQTRFKKGDDSRKGKEVRLQECLDKRNRNRKG